MNRDYAFFMKIIAISLFIGALSFVLHEAYLLDDFWYDVVRIIRFILALYLLFWAFHALLNKWNQR